MNDKNKTKGFWKHIIPYIKPYFKRLIITVICAMVVGAMVAIQPLVIKWIVDEGISNDMLNNNEKMSFVVKMCVFYVTISAVRIGSWALAYTNILKTLEGILFSIRSNFFDHVQNMHFKFFEKTSVGELFNCIMGSPITNVKTYLQTMFLNVPYQAISLVVSLFALSTYDWFLTILLLLTVATMATINFLSKRRVRTAF